MSRITLVDSPVAALEQPFKNVGLFNPLMAELENKAILVYKDQMLSHSEITLIRSLMSFVVQDLEEVSDYMKLQKEGLWELCNPEDKSIQSELNFKELNEIKDGLRGIRKKKAIAASILKKLKLQLK